MNTQQEYNNLIKEIFNLEDALDIFIRHKIIKPNRQQDLTMRTIIQRKKKEAINLDKNIELNNALYICYC